MSECPITDIRIVPASVDVTVPDSALPSYTLIDLADKGRIEFSKDFNSLPLVNFKVGLEPCLLDGELG